MSRVPSRLPIKHVSGFMTKNISPARELKPKMATSNAVTGHVSDYRTYPALTTVSTVIRPDATCA